MMARGVGRRGMTGAFSRAVRRCGVVVSSVIVIGYLSSCAGAPEPGASAGAGSGSSTDGFPVTIENCGRKMTVDKAPERAVALGSRTALTLVALGLEDRLVGTVNPLEPHIAPEPWREAYTSLPVLAAKDLSRENFLAAEPDFVYAAEDSAFTAKGVGTPEELNAQGIASYLHTEECPRKEDAEYTWDTLWGEIGDLSRIFGVPARGKELIQDQKETLKQVREASPGAGIEVLIWDMNTKSPLVVAGGGGPQLILDTIGATNVFQEIDKDWASVSWEQVVAADPDVIIVTNAPWSSADEKVAYLESDPTLSRMTAVKEQRYVTTTYSAINTSVRFVGTAETLGQELAQFDALDAK